MLSDRQRLILSAIVDDYIRSAEPVGSRSISKREDVTFSPATIRNEMSDLEDMGFLEQPHTSAGRIPSHKGYRYYVDHLVDLARMNNLDSRELKQFFTVQIQQTEKVMQQVAAIFSNITSYTSIALGPEMFHTTLRHLQLVPMSDEAAVVIIVTNTGQVENRMVSIPKDVPVSEIERFVNFFNAKLTGVPLLHLKSKLYNEIGDELSRHVAGYEELIHLVEGVLNESKEEKLYTSGMTHMLAQPEFKDVEKVKSLLELFDESRTLVRLLSSQREGIQVQIGAENNVEAIHNCSLITATYSMNGMHIGTIGILGPTRMEYAKVMNLLQYLSDDISDILSRWYK